jgi:prefoldin subunit 5
MNLAQKFIDLQDQLKELLEDAKEEGREERQLEEENKSYNEGYEDAEVTIAVSLGIDAVDCRSVAEAARKVRKERDDYKREVQKLKDALEDYQDDKTRMDWIDSHTGLTINVDRAVPTLRDRIDRLMSSGAKPT